MAHQYFTPGVKEALNYYVYALVDPRDHRIFYIGKGKGDRVFQHAEDSLVESLQSDKLDTIRAIRNQGKDVQYYILRHNLTEETAYLVESVLIDMLTYAPFNLEKLLTNITSGYHQWDEGIKIVEEINALYDCEKIVPIDGEYLLLVSLNKTYNQSKAGGVYKRPNPYEAARRYWKIDPNRITKIDYILGVYKGIVRIVIKPKPTSWQPYDESDDGTIFNCPRWGCEGDIIEDSPYMNKDVTDFPFGSGGAITYIPRDRRLWF